MGLLGGLGGSIIAGAGVKLYLDDKAYNAGLAKAEASGKKATTGIAGGFSKLKLIGTAVFAALAYAAVNFAGDAIAAAREHETAVVGLTVAMKGETTALTDQATALQMLTGFSDEAIIQADTLLSRYDLTQEQLLKLNPLLLDYARFTGQDAASAAGSLGKALLGNTRALKAVGIEFTATGDRTRDLNTLMDGLQTKVGGVSEAFAQTSAGKAAILNEQFDEFKETVGAGLLPILGALIDLLISMQPVISVVGGAVKYVLVGIAGAMYLLEDAVGLLGTLADHILGPLYDFDGSMSHLSDNAAELQGVLDGTSGAVMDTADSFTIAESYGMDYQQRVNAIRVATTKFVHMTGDDLANWLADTKTTFSGAQTVWDKFGEKAHVTAGQVIRAFMQQNRALTHYAENVREVRDKGLEDAVLESLSHMGLEGAQILEGLAGASKKQIDKVNATFDTNVDKAGIVTRSLTGVGDTIDKLKGASAKATVTVEYKVAGVDPRTLPGVGTK